jgi:hypothetical protein
MALKPRKDISMIIALAAAATLLASPQAEAALADLGADRAAALAECGVDEVRLAELLALDQQAFDQDMDGGWRPVGRTEGCEAAAADLIAAWREHSGNLVSSGIIDWHEGQMRAYAGETEAAIALFDRARSDSPEWNLYVDATIAFLEGDRAALEAARAELATYVPSPEVIAARRQFLEDNPQIQVPDGFVEQPQNLNVVDNLLACFGRSYAEAYGTACAPEPADPRIEVSEAECAFAASRFEVFIAEAPPGDIRNAISANWLTTPAERDALAALLAQEGRERGPDAPFAMGYRPDFARAIEPLSEADIDRFHAGLTLPGAITCDGVDTAADPFTDDLAGFNTWAEGQMMNPDPGAPEGAQTLAISRPMIFDGGGRALVAQSYTYTPIPLSRPPSATLAFMVYERDGAGWTHAASMILARGG